MIERRAAPRQRVFKGGFIAFEGIQIDCIVRNISQNGALIDFNADFELPTDFRLTIASDRLIRKCRPVWSKEKKVGVAFVDSPGAWKSGLPSAV